LLASAAAVLSSAGQQRQEQLSNSPVMTAGQRLAAAFPDGILSDKKIKSSSIPAAMLVGAADLYSHDSLSTVSQLNPRMSSIVDGAFNRDKSKRKREDRQMRQMSRHEITVDDPFMTNNVNIGSQPVNNLIQEMGRNHHHWGWEHHNWN
jgi:hypothetical protein